MNSKGDVIVQWDINGSFNVTCISDLEIAVFCEPLKRPIPIIKGRNKSQIGYVSEDLSCYDNAIPVLWQTEANCEYVSPSNISLLISSQLLNLRVVWKHDRDWTGIIQSVEGIERNIVIIHD